jgi:hypothetical protein
VSKGCNREDIDFNFFEFCEILEHMRRQACKQRSSVTELPRCSRGRRRTPMASEVVPTCGVYRELFESLAVFLALPRLTMLGADEYRSVANSDLELSYKADKTHCRLLSWFQRELRNGNGDVCRNRR